MESIIKDIRYGMRSLLKRPGSTVIALVTLALGIGVNTAIFSAVDSILLRPLPLKDPERLYGEQNLELYVPYMQERRGFVAPRDLVVRTKGDAASLAGAVRQAVWAVDKDQPVSDVRTMDQVFAAAISQERFQTLLLGMFAALALVLACVGLYGVISYSVAQRTHEIGVRVALGAQPADVLRLVIRQGMMLTLAGLVVGIAAGSVATRVLSDMLYGVTTTDPLTFAGVPAFLLLVAFLACYIPARRATRIDPLVALRSE